MGYKKRTQALLAASMFAVLTALTILQVYRGVDQGYSCLIIAPLVAIALLFSMCCALCLDVWRLNPADSHTMSSLLSQYRYLLYKRIRWPYVRWYIERQTKDIRKTSEEILLDILQTNQNSEYGRKCRFSKLRSRENFVQQHPLTRYTHYKQYIDRIVNGETNILSCSKTVFLFTTSGTTGPPKTYPFTLHRLNTYMFQLSDIVQSAFLPLMNLQRFGTFHVCSSVRRTASGIPIGPSSQMAYYRPGYSLLPEAFSRLHKEGLSYYAQGLFSLAERELRGVLAFPADLMYSYMNFITTNWENLCNDIANGEIGAHIDMAEDVKAELSFHLRADPQRAEELRQAMEHGTVGLAKRIWPDIQFVTMGKSASYRMSASALMKTHFKGVKLIDLTHSSSEGLVGFNLEGPKAHLDSVFTLSFVPSVFLEFIPLDMVDQDKTPHTLFPEQVQLGETYEVVFTTVDGLYRYRSGDVIQIVGFKNSTPKFRYLYRLEHRLSVAQEKTPDTFILEAIERSLQGVSSGGNLVNFTSTERITIAKTGGLDAKGHYVVFLEFDDNKAVDEMVIAQKIDGALGALHEGYRAGRSTGLIGPLEVVQVKCGTFEEVKTFIWNDTPHGQFKMPRVVRQEPALRYLLSQAVHP